MSEIGLDVGLANDLKLAFRRNDFTTEQVQRLKEGDLLGLVRGVLLGTHEIKAIEHVIDLGAAARLPFSGAEVEVHRGSGVVKLERRADGLYLNDKKLGLFRSRKQKKGSSVGGHDLRKELKGRGNNVSAKVLDYLVAHPELWPEEWKKDEDGNTLYVFFWDDIFRSPAHGGLCVRCGDWHDGEVVSFYDWLDGGWHGNDPAASSAS